MAGAIDSHLPPNPVMEMPRVAEICPEANDIDLIRKAAAGDGRAFHVLVDRHAQSLYRLAVSLTGQPVDAEDIVQETFAGAFRGMAKFEGRSSVKTWLTRILFTQAAQWRRNRAGRVMGSIEHAEPAGSGQSASVEARLDLQTALRRLSPEHREVLVLRELQGLSYEEVAEVLGIPRGTVESRLHRARRELRGKLSSYEVEEA
jgi:RNA polymerase sigma-70 factor (ECF subfamily)